MKNLNSLNRTSLSLVLALAASAAPLSQALAESSWFAATLKRPLHLASGEAYLTADGKVHESRKSKSCKISLRELKAETGYDRLARGVNARSALNSNGRVQQVLPERSRSKILSGTTLLPGTVVRSGGITGSRMDQTLFSYSDDASHSVAIDCGNLSVSEASGILAHHFTITRPANGVGLDRPVRLAVASSNDSRIAGSNNKRESASSSSSEVRQARLSGKAGSAR